MLLLRYSIERSFRDKVQFVVKSCYDNPFAGVVFLLAE